MNALQQSDVVLSALDELALARRYSEALVADLDPDQVAWRPSHSSSAIGWHLGHQAVVAHFLMRNLTAAEPEIDRRLDRLFDSATPEPDRGELPPLTEVLEFRTKAFTAVETTVRRIARGDVGAPTQLAEIASVMLRAMVNHEYQHAQWIEEVRAGLTKAAPPAPTSAKLVRIEGYWVLGAP